MDAQPDKPAPFFTGSCHCGAVSFSFTGPAGTLHCHCGQCRHLSGAAFTTWVSVRKEAITLEGGPDLSAYAYSPNATRHFCRHCGTHVHTTDVRHPHILGLPAGVIDGPLLPAAPKAHYFTSHQAAWHTIGDGLPCFGGETGFEPVAG